MKSNNPYTKHQSRIRSWRSAAVALEAVRRAEIAQLDTCSVIEELSGLIDHAIESAPLRKESGLVMQQQLFRKLRDEQAIQSSS